MAHLASSYSSFETFLNNADGIWTVDLTALNSSGVSGTAIVATSTDDDGNSYLNVAISGEGMTPNQVHAQHIHGRFGPQGNPIDSVSPTLAQDADADGMVEVLEGVGQYGDILLPLVSPEGGGMPRAGSDGVVSFIQSYDLGDAANFGSPVTGNDYTADDIMPLALREIVLHGVNVPDDIGAGTEGEVDGGVNGYTGLLPAAAGEIEASTLTDALRILGEQNAAANGRFTLGAGDDSLDAGLGDDTVFAGTGNDTVAGNSGNDNLFGLAGDDLMYGSGGNDFVLGGAGADTIYAGSGEDTVRGLDGDDLLLGVNGDDLIEGNAGNDKMFGGNGDDLMFGGNGDDTVVGNADDDRMFGGNDDDRLYGVNGADLAAGGNGNDVIFAGNGADTVQGGAGGDKIFGVNGDDDVSAGTGNDTAFGGAGDDTLLGEDGDDNLFGIGGDDLLVGGAGNDLIRGGAGADIIGGGAGDDTVTGNAGADEFHFDAGTGSDMVTDFVQGADVISFLDGGAIDFANSSTDDTRGDSDLSAADFDAVANIAGLDAGNDQQVVFSAGGSDDAANAEGAAVEAYLAANNGTDTSIYYDDDWSSAEGRELIATLDDFSSAMTAADFDVY